MPPNTDRLIGPWRLRIAMLTGAHVVGTVNVVSVLAMAPVIQRVLDLSATEFGFVMTSYYCGQATWSLPAGALVDRAGVGGISMMAMAGIAIGTSVVATAQSLTMLLLGMYLMGSGYSFTNPSTAKGVFDWFPRRRRATAMGAKQTGVPIGGVVAAGLGVLAASIDWRLLLGIVVAATLVFGASCVVLRDSPQHPDRGRRNPLSGLLELLRDWNYGRFALSNLLYNFGQGNFFGFLTLFVRDALHGSQESLAFVSVLRRQLAPEHGSVGACGAIFYSTAGVKASLSELVSPRFYCWREWAWPRPDGRQRLFCCSLPVWASRWQAMPVSCKPCLSRRWNCIRRALLSAITASALIWALLLGLQSSVLLSTRQVVTAAVGS